MENITVYPYGTDGQLPSSIGIINDLVTGGADKALSAEQGKVLNALIDEINGSIKNESRQQNYFKNYAVKKVANQEKATVYSLDGWGLMVVNNIISGDTIKIVFGTVGGNANDNPFALLTNYHINYHSYFSYNGYTNERTITADGLYTTMLVSFKLVKDDGEINKTPVFVNGVPIEITGYVEGDDDRNWHDVEFGGFVQSDSNSNGDLNNSTEWNPVRCCTASKIVIPSNAGKMRFIDTNNNYLQAYMFYLDASGTALSTRASITCFSGDVVASLNESRKTTRWVFMKRKTFGGTGAASFYNITPQDLSGVHIQYYSEDDSSVVERNAANEIALLAGERTLAKNGNTWNMSLNGMNKMPVIAHISDIHGDSLRLGNFLDYCDYYGVDAAIGSGDMTMYVHENGTKFQDRLSEQHTTPYLFCIGNHESWPTGQSTLFADNISSLASHWEYMADSENVTSQCYYYKDFASKSLRVIAVNYYEDGVYNGRIGQTQAEWLVSTLASTPSGYGVVIVLHAPEDMVVVDAEYNKFRQPLPNTGESYQPNGFYVGGRPIMSIVDAFISRGSGNIEFYDHASNYTGSANTGFSSTATVVSYDFTSVPSDVEFICYCCGHRHEDWIGYYNSSVNKQLVLLVTCGNARFGDSSNYAYSDQSDLPRGCTGVSQDAFNIYCIDRYNKCVKVVRIGATLTEKFNKRDYMMIPYKD